MGEQKEAVRQASGAEVRRVRRSLDMTQWQLARLANCSQASVVAAERGQRVGPELFERIVSALLAAGTDAKGQG